VFEGSCNCGVATRFFKSFAASDSEKQWDYLGQRKFHKFPSTQKRIEDAGCELPFGLDVGAAGNILAVMNMNVAPHEFPVWLALLIPVIILLALWDGVWKVIGMWKSARNKQLVWFICIAVFNTIGILPIVYLTLCQKDRNQG